MSTDKFELKLAPQAREPLTAEEQVAHDAMVREYAEIEAEQAKCEHETGDMPEYGMGPEDGCFKCGWGAK